MTSLVQRRGVSPVLLSSLYFLALADRRRLVLGFWRFDASEPIRLPDKQVISGLSYLFRP